MAFHGEGGELVAVILADGMDMDDRTLVEKARATLLQVARFGDYVMTHLMRCTMGQRRPGNRRPNGLGSLTL